MSRASHVKNVGSNLLLKTDLPNTNTRTKMCTCGLKCRDICYRQEYNELIHALDQVNGLGLKRSSMTITVSTSGRRQIEGGGQVERKKRRCRAHGAESTHDSTDSSYSGSRTLSTSSGVRDGSDSSQVRVARLQRMVESCRKGGPSFQEKDLLDIVYRPNVTGNYP